MVTILDNLSIDNLHVPKWLLPLNDHSIKLYKTEWLSSGWPDLVVPIS
jgi:hypothetical protein